MTTTSTSRLPMAKWWRSSAPPATKCGARRALAHRGLSAPVLTDDAVAVADFKGYVHWLDKATGAFAGRAEAGGERVSKPPIAVGDRVVVDQ